MTLCTRGPSGARPPTERFNLSLRLIDIQAQMGCARRGMDGDAGSQGERWVWASWRLRGLLCASMLTVFFRWCSEREDNRVRKKKTGCVRPLEKPEERSCTPTVLHTSAEASACSLLPFQACMMLFLCAVIIYPSDGFPAVALKGISAWAVLGGMISRRGPVHWF